jgi:Domain of unknown function (DUF4340)
VKPRTLLVLLALVVGLGAFVWFYEREQPGSEEREKLAKRVLGIEREDVVGLELHAGDRTTELVRTREAGEGKEKAEGASESADAEAGGTSGDDQDQWRLRRPIDFPADYWQVDALVRTLAELDFVRELDPFDAKEVGLDPPRGRVVVALEGGKRKELRIGSEVPGSGNLVVAVEGEPGASVVAGSLWESIDKEAAEWRDKDLFSPEREDIAELTLEHAGGTAAEGETGATAAGPAAGAEGATSAGSAAANAAAASSSRVVLSKAGDDFELAQPIRDRADADAVNALLRELTGLRASEFLDAPPSLASIGLDPPRARLSVKLNDGEPFVLLWGARKEGAQESYAKVGDLVVITAAALDEAFERPVAAWRSKEWSSMPVFEVDQVTVSDANGSLTVTRDEGSWKRGEDAIDYGPVSDLLYAIDDARAERIAEPTEAAALGAPEITINFGSVDEAEKAKTPAASGAPSDSAAPSGSAQPSRTERLELFAATAENLVPARTDGRDAVLLLRRETRDQIVAKLQAVRDAKPPSEEPTPAPGDDEAEEGD